MGVDLGQGLPVFKGQWNPANPGAASKSYAFLRFTGAHYWDIERLSAENYYYGVRADTSSHLQWNGRDPGAAPGSPCRLDGRPRGRLQPRGCLRAPVLPARALSPSTHQGRSRSSSRFTSGTL
ncbi:hypothetical protein ACN28S_32145 [Cystobacter fuscus]